MLAPSGGGCPILKFDEKNWIQLKSENLPKFYFSRDWKTMEIWITMQYPKSKRFIQKQLKLQNKKLYYTIDKTSWSSRKNFKCCFASIIFVFYYTTNLNIV